MLLFNDIFNQDDIKINYFNKRYLKIIIVIVIILFLVLFLIKKNYYYENDIIQNSDGIILLVDKDMINSIKRQRTIVINNIESDYDINKVINDKDICYLEINLKTDIKNIEKAKYKIFLGKETILEYIIRIIKKV